MAPKSSPEKEAAYQADKAFTLHLARLLDELARHDPSAQSGAGAADGPANEGDGDTSQPEMEKQLAESLAAVEPRSRARARQGLETALQTLLEMTRDFPPAAVTVLDDDFRSRGLMSLSDMRDRVSKIFSKVLARGRITTAAEYSLLMERSNDVSAGGLTDEQRASVNSMIAEYEARVARKR